MNMNELIKFSFHDFTERSVVTPKGAKNAVAILALPIYDVELPLGNWETGEISGECVMVAFLDGKKLPFKCFVDDEEIKLAVDDVLSFGNLRKRLERDSESYRIVFNNEGYSVKTECRAPDYDPFYPPHAFLNAVGFILSRMFAGYACYEIGATQVDLGEGRVDFSRQVLGSCIFINQTQVDPELVKSMSRIALNFHLFKMLITEE